ncbi:hypothetical protein J3E69DRAFT_88507 [Trichoderma sp. SZMC 28015]
MLLHSPISHNIKSQATISQYTYSTVAKSNQIEFSPPLISPAFSRSPHAGSLVSGAASLIVLCALVASFTGKRKLTGHANSRWNRYEPWQKRQRAPPYFVCPMLSLQRQLRNHTDPKRPPWHPLHFGLLGGNNDISFPKACSCYGITRVYCVSCNV